MDAAGWVAIEDLLANLSVSREDFDRVVAENNKRRFEVDGPRVRASQGHSVDGMPLTVEALEASWHRYEGPDSIWHGTQLDAVASIASSGVHSGARSHVHLAATTDSEVGKRSYVAVLLEVSVARLRAAGREVFVSSNGVVLCRDVPAGCIVGLTAQTKRARSRVDELRELLGLGSA